MRKASPLSRCRRASRSTITRRLSSRSSRAWSSSGETPAATKPPSRACAQASQQGGEAVVALRVRRGEGLAQLGRGRAQAIARGQRRQGLSDAQPVAQAAEIAGAAAAQRQARKGSGHIARAAQTGAQIAAQVGLV
jgi:hypothetical protein